MDGCSPQAEGEKYKISHGLWVYVFEMTSDLYGVWGVGDTCVCIGGECM